ncbi:Thymidylate synthase [Azospirillaceae bacterium]
MLFAMGSPMALFEPLYFSDRLHVINSAGDIGVATLWTPVSTAIDFLARAGVDLSSVESRIAVVANLYGDGLPQMIRNLLWNPQINHILILGQDLSGSGRELENLLTKGVVRAERLGQPRFRIIDTERFLDIDFEPAHLTTGCSATRFGKLGSQTMEDVRAFFAKLGPPCAPERLRIHAPLRDYQPSYFPSEPRGHTIVRRRPLDAWKELVFRTMRHGIPSIASGTKKRLELQNVKVVVKEALDDHDEDLNFYGFSLVDFRAYQESFLCPEKPEDVHYSYGFRLRAHWSDPDGRPLDALQRAAEILRADSTSRGAYLSLWDPTLDMTLGGERSAPCLVSMFFRVFQDRLTLTATFRAHNIMSAWLRNFYGLMAAQRMVAAQAGDLPLGAITVISHSISIDPTAMERFDLAQQITRDKKDDRELDRETGKRILREDPNGYFTFTLDPEAGEIVADLKLDGETLTRYRGARAQDIETQIARDQAISELSHALYVGRQLALLEIELGSGKKSKKQGECI